jgi:hypothetical protein
MTEENKKSFSLEDKQFDLTTYWGRVAHIRQSSNVRYAFQTASMVREKIALINLQTEKE